MGETDIQQINIRDHDLLVRLETKMEGVSKDIKEIKDNSAERLNRLEDGKVDKSEFKTYCEDHMKAMNTLVESVKANKNESEQSIASFKKEVHEKYVTGDTFNPLKMLVYGFTAIILTVAIVGMVYAGISFMVTHPESPAASTLIN